MLEGLYIIHDLDLDTPLYADPDPSDVDEEAWDVAKEAIVEAVDGDGSHDDVQQVGELLVGWRYLSRPGVSFVAIVTDDVSKRLLKKFLKMLSKHYLNEVDDPTDPERDGLYDVVVDVIPPWEDEED